MAITAAQIAAKVTEAVTAAESGDYATAISRLQSAKAFLIALPDTEHDGTKNTWDRGAIDKLIADYRLEQTRAAAASGGIRQTKVVYRRDC